MIQIFILIKNHMFISLKIPIKLTHTLVLIFNLFMIQEEVMWELDDVAELGSKKSAQHLLRHLIQHVPPL